MRVAPTVSARPCAGMRCPPCHQLRQTRGEVRECAVRAPLDGHERQPTSPIPGAWSYRYARLPTALRTPPEDANVGSCQIHAAVVEAVTEVGGVSASRPEERAADEDRC